MSRDAFLRNDNVIQHNVRNVAGTSLIKFFFYCAYQTIYCIIVGKIFIITRIVFSQLKPSAKN